MTRALLPVAIAGGGIGGLAAALALAQRGIPTIVCERRSAFVEDGAGIQIGPNGSRILQHLGVGDAMREIAAAPDGLSVRDGASGRELTRLPLGAWMDQRHGAPYWTAHRKDLHAAIVARVEQNEMIALRFSTDVSTWLDTDISVEAVTSRAERISAQALIAADGLWSRLRHQVSPSAPPTPTGRCAFRCVVQRSAVPAGIAPDDVGIWLAAGAHAVHYPVRRGREIALVLIVDDARTETNWSAEIAPDLAGNPVARLAGPLRKLLDAGTDWRKWSLHKAAPLSSWSKGRVALLGDAAHPVLPFLAQGAALALEDAVALADALASQSGEVAGSLAAYSAARRPRAARVASASARNGRIYHLSGPLALARNAVLRTAPPPRLMAGYDWLYGWKA